LIEYHQAAYPHATVAGPGVWGLAQAAGPGRRVRNVKSL